MASCRYRHDDFRPFLIPVPPLRADALFRLMGWFKGLRRLSTKARAQLVGRLAGHPRAVEYADDLIQKALLDWEDKHGPWRLADPPSAAELERKWSELIEAALPRVETRLADDLRLAGLWDRVLNDRAHRMLFRMTLLHLPWEWDLVSELGEEGEPASQTEHTAERLRRTSLLEQLDVLRQTGYVPHFTIHPATAQFAARHFPADSVLRQAAHRRVGTYYETLASKSPYIEDHIEAGHHLFQAREFDRSFDLLGAASTGHLQRGRVREGLQLLAPFLAETVQEVMTRNRLGRLLGTVGIAYARLGESERAISFLEQDLDIAREIGDRPGEGAALGNLGLAYADLGQFERAISFHEQDLAIAGEIRNRHSEGAALGNLGNAYCSLGHVERAIILYWQQLAITREIGDRYGEVNALGNLGAAIAAVGLVEQAFAFSEQCLAITRKIGDRSCEGNTLVNLGNAYAGLGQVERAIELLEQAHRIGQEIKDPNLLRFASSHLKRLRGGESVPQTGSGG